MAERFIVMPVGYVLGSGEFPSVEAAAAHAARMVDSDRTPRVVLQVIGTTTPSKEPKADFHRHDEQGATA